MLVWLDVKADGFEVSTTGAKRLDVKADGFKVSTTGVDDSRSDVKADLEATCNVLGTDVKAGSGLGIILNIPTCLTPTASSAISSAIDSCKYCSLAFKSLSTFIPFNLIESASSESDNRFFVVVLSVTRLPNASTSNLTTGFSSLNVNNVFCVGS